MNRMRNSTILNDGNVYNVIALFQGRSWVGVGISLRIRVRFGVPITIFAG